MLQSQQLRGEDGIPQISARWVVDRMLLAGARRRVDMLHGTTRAVRRAPRMATRGARRASLS